MTARTLCAAVVASIALLGCADGPPDKASASMTGIQASRCVSGACIMYVTVGGNPLTVKVSEPTLQVPANNANAVILWQLRTDGYEFRQGSIRFKGDNAAIANRNMIHPSHSTKVYNLIDTHMDFGEFKYEITVYDATTGTPIPLDPSIVNN